MLQCISLDSRQHLWEQIKKKRHLKFFVILPDLKPGTRLYPLSLQQSQEALHCAAAWIHDELSQSADEQRAVCPFRAVNKNRMAIPGINNTH